MYFINPYFLFASFLIIIPIIIHLFNFRKYKKVYFSNVEFLREIKSQTQKSSVLKHLLVLIARILAILSLVFAFAQPYIPLAGTKKIIQKSNLISIFADNSFSMDAVNGNGRLLDEAKSKASDISSVYKSSDLFQILSDDFEGKNQRFISLDEFRQNVNDIKTSSFSKNISEIFSRQKDLLSSNNSKSKNAYIISDFQKNMCDFDKIKNDSLINVYLIPLHPDKNDNIYIDSVWFETPVLLPEQKIKLNVRIFNNSQNEVEKIPVKLFVNSKQRALASFSIQPFSHTDISLPFTITETGINSAMLEITDFPVTFDNTFFFSYFVKQKLSVAAINFNSENTFLKSLFAKDSAFTFDNFNASRIDYSLFNNYSLIILNGLNDVSSGLSQEISKFLNHGGSCVILPGDNIDLNSYQDFLKQIGSAYFVSKDTANTKISEINLNNPVYKDVFEKIPENADLPKVFSHYVINSFSKSLSESLLKLQNNNEFLSLQYVDKGKLYLFAAPLDISFTNFPKHSLFVPTLYNIALLSFYNSALYYITGKDNIINLQNYSESGENVLKVKQINKDFEVIPEFKNNGFEANIALHDQIKDAGNYIVIDNDKPIMGLSFNFDRKESEMKYFDAPALEKLIEKHNLKNFHVIDVKNKPISKALSEINLGFRLWKWFIILALLFLASEIIIIRIFK